MIIKTIQYTTNEGGLWNTLHLTPDEIHLLEEYVNSIATPVLRGYVDFPQFRSFFPRVFVQAIRFEHNTWDTMDGWSLRHGS